MQYRELFFTFFCLSLYLQTFMMVKPVFYKIYFLPFLPQMYIIKYLLLYLLNK